MKKLKVILIGAGGRGKTYTDIMSESTDKFEVVGVAEPIEDRREYIKNKHNVSEEYCFDTWEKILDVPKFADVAIISTMDRMHYEPSIKALELGYDLLLEKPVAPTPEECVGIYKKAEECGRKIIVCHVLRYTEFFNGVKDIVDSGKLGKIMTVMHTEAVENRHQSHSFVRGNWGNSQRSSTMLLQKSCHDLDILQWLLGKKCKKVQSFGFLSHFTEKNAPEGAPDYCIQGCPAADTCYYNAVKLYLEDEENDWFRGAATGMVKPSNDDVKEALLNTQYGKCVYKCDNDVVDHQVVNMLFEDDLTVSFTMAAFNKGGRSLRIMGTDGEFTADMESEKGVLFDFATRQETEIDLTKSKHGEGIQFGHGGGDNGIIVALYDYITGRCSAKEVSEIGISAQNHMMVFAAEESRLNNTVVDVNDFMKKYY